MIKLRPNNALFFSTAASLAAKLFVLKSLEEIVPGYRPIKQPQYHNLFAIAFADDGCLITGYCHATSDAHHPR